MLLQCTCSFVLCLSKGDPLQDLEYSQQYQSDYIVPEVIKNFLIFFQKSIDVNDMSEILNCYENGLVLHGWHSNCVCVAFIFCIGTY